MCAEASGGCEMGDDKIISVSGKDLLTLFRAESRELCGKLAWRGELLHRARVYLGKLICLRVQASFKRNEESAC
ncbi:hypothetical protein NCCP436_05540 [Pseudomonas sp. NCCP-436]|nr:hypothetical protein NCCP436_05540 [Pseudomonas sp. NCCP-436]